MTFLPIVERELRVLSRRPQMYWGRWLPVIVVALFGGQQIAMAMLFPKMANGFGLFAMVSVMIALMGAVSGFAGADNISQEKREGTLGFLFLTDLKGRDIVLGKLAASAAPSIYMAMGTLPIIAMALFLGGITAAQFWKTSLAILNIFFISHASAMLGSALFRKRGNAGGFPMLVIAFYVIAIWMPAVLAQQHGHTTAAFWLNVFNPGWTLYMGLVPNPAFTRGYYYISVAVVHLTGWMFIALASVVLPHCWQDKPKKPQTWRMLWERVRFGSTARRAALRRELIGQNPFFWLVSRGQIGPRGIWIAIGLIFTAIGIFVRSDTTLSWERVSETVCMVTTIAFHLGLRIGAAGATGASLETQRQNGGLEVVLSCTPLSVREVLAGLWLALRRWLLWPAVVLIVFGILSAMIGLMTLSHNDQDRESFIWFILIASIMLLPDMWASSWVAMWAAMSNKKKQRAATGGAIVVLITPWMVFGLINGVYVLLTHNNPLPPFGFWLVIGLLTDYGLARFSRWRLEKNFRLWAVPSYEHLGFWGYAGRFVGRFFRS